jgi:threonine-phosphate decarboxylase
LGYITAHVSLAEHLRQFLHPWSVSALAIETGMFLLRNDDELRCKPDLNEAQRLREKLQQIDGIHTHETQTNFILCQFESGHTAAELKDYLARQHHLLIRDASNFKGLTPRHFRIAAQTPAENDALVTAIRQFVKTV